MKAITFNLLAWVMLPIMDGFAKYLSGIYISRRENLVKKVK